MNGSNDQAAQQHPQEYEQYLENPQHTQTSYGGQVNYSQQEYADIEQRQEHLQPQQGVDGSVPTQSDDDAHAAASKKAAGKDPFVPLPSEIEEEHTVYIKSALYVLCVWRAVDLCCACTEILMELSVDLNEF